MDEIRCETCPHWEIDAVSVKRNKEGFTSVRGLCRAAHDRLPYSVVHGGPLTMPNEGVGCPWHPMSEWRKL